MIVGSWRLPFAQFQGYHSFSHQSYFIPSSIILHPLINHPSSLTNHPSIKPVHPEKNIAASDADDGGSAGFQPGGKADEGTGGYRDRNIVVGAGTAIIEFIDYFHTIQFYNYPGGVDGTEIILLDAEFIGGGIAAHVVVGDVIRAALHITYWPKLLYRAFFGQVLAFAAGEQ